MSSGGKNDKPPENEGGASAAPAAAPGFYPWWRNERRIAWYVTSDKETDPFTQLGADGVRVLATIAFSQHQLKAYQLLEGILKERASNLAAAVAQNMYRHGLDGRGVDWTVGTGAAVTGVIAGEPILGFVIGGLIAAGRSFSEVWRHRRAVSRARNESAKNASNQIAAEMRLHMLMLKRRIVGAGQITPVDEIPQLEEFRNGWVRSAWRLTHLIIGYNLRVAAINALTCDETMGWEDRQAACEMAELLVEQRARLIRVRRALDQLCTIEKGSFKRLEKHNERLDGDDLFDDRKVDPPSLDWLAIPSGVLLPTEVRRQHEIDRQVLEACREVETQEIDKQLARLERREAEQAASAAIEELEIEPDSDD